MFLLFVHITPLFNRQECFISNGKLINKCCSRHDLAELLLKLALNTNQSFSFRHILWKKGGAIFSLALLFFVWIYHFFKGTFGLRYFVLVMLMLSASYTFN